MAVRTMAKIICSAYDEVSYYNYDLNDKGREMVAIRRGAFLNRRLKISAEERETGFFSAADGCDLVERWLPIKNLFYVYVHNALTGQVKYYQYDKEVHEFVTIEKSRIIELEEEHEQLIKTRAALSVFSGEAIEDVIKPDTEKLNYIWPAVFRCRETGHLGTIYLGAIDYISSNEKVFFYECGSWKPLPPERIFYRLAGIMEKRRAVSYLPLKPNTYVKVLRKKYHNSFVARQKDTEKVSVEEQYYYNEGPDGAFNCLYGSKKERMLQQMQKDTETERMVEIKNIQAVF